jgi:hypothetical protein
MQGMPITAPERSDVPTRLETLNSQLSTINYCDQPRRLFCVTIVPKANRVLRWLHHHIISPYK